MEWKIELEGDKIDLDYAYNYLTSEDVFVTKNENKYFLESKLFNGIEDAKEVKRIADNILKIFNGALWLYNNSSQQIKILAVVSIDESGKEHNYLFPSKLVAKVRFSGSLKLIKVDKHRNVIEEKGTENSNTFSNAVSMSLNDNYIRKLMTLLSINPINWSTLYKIYEVVVNDLGGLNQIPESFNITKSKLKLFKQTANHQDAVGIKDSRHGAMRTEPPSKKMEKAEADNLIKALASNWIIFKNKQKLSK